MKKTIYYVILILLFCYTQSCNEEKSKYGYEYLNDSIHDGKFIFFNSIRENRTEVEEGVDEGFEIDSIKYINHFLFLLDTISNYTDFICMSSLFFDNSMPVPWGFFAGDWEHIRKYPEDTISNEKFQILKYNIIHGASLIVNSCLYSTYIPNNEDSELFMIKYLRVYNDKERMNDSVMECMHEDIEILCKKYN